MSRVQKFRLFVTQRLHVAVEDILAAFEETLVKYEQEAALTQEVISRQHALLCALNKPLMEAAQSGDVITKQLLVSNDSVPLEHQDQETPEPPLVREEGGPPPHLAEDDIIHFTYSTRCSVRPDQEVHLVSSETEDSEDYSQDPPDHPSASPHRHPSVSQPPSASPHRLPSVSQPPSRSPVRGPSVSQPPSRSPVRGPSVSQPPSRSPVRGPSASPLRSSGGQACRVLLRHLEITEKLKLHIQTPRTPQTRTRSTRRVDMPDTNVRVPASEKTQTCPDCGRSFRQVWKKRRHKCQRDNHGKI